ncbi:hypothetical protein GCM10010915_06210 [Microbacterium faecale]|uniref:Uncharacterized protein n=1 Tax=Microbacterium faecale TaxID=1804630 RepID=A0A916Y347_9MICO|nr:hypothetical protein [Microbacterium faecale]GGD28879.1 hypothetical protein GCM10010915_06210 [Microbacterium faecale]
MILSNAVDSSVIGENIIASTWFVGLLAIAFVAVGIVAIVPPLPSPRITPRERRPPARLADSERLGVIDDNATHAWNALVEEHAIPYAHARRFARLAKRWFRVGALVAIPIALLAPSMMWINYTADALSAASGGGLPYTTAMVIAGSMFAIPFAGILIGAAATSFADKVIRDREPFAWKIVTRGSTALRWLSGSNDTYRGLAHERPRSMEGEGSTLSASMARFLLDPLEAEIVVGLTASARSTPGRAVEWHERDAHVVSALLREKAQLLAAPHATVSVGDLYEWLDLVAARCVLDPPRTADLSEVPIAEVLMGDRAVRNARRTLGLGASAALNVAVAAAFLAFALAIVGLGLLLPLLGPLPATWMEALVAPILVGAFLGLGGWAWRSLTSRRRSP